MKKTLLMTVAVLCVGALALLTSCGGAGAGDKVVLKVLANVDNSTTDGKDWKALVDAFKVANPNIDVQDVTVYAEAYHQKARVMLSSKDYPHVAYIWPDARGVYFKEAGQLVDNRPFLDADYYDFSQIPPMGDNGEVWEVPAGASNFTTILFVNTAILKKYNLPEPKTYEDLVKMVAPLNKAGISVISMDGSEGWVWNSCLMSGVVARYGGDPHWIKKASEGTYKFTDPAFVKSLALISTMMKDGVLPKATMVTDYGTALTNFITGKAAFMLDGQWRTNGIEDPQLQKDVKLMALPTLPGESAQMAGSTSAAISVGFGITKAATEDPKVLDAAKKFLKAYYSEEQVLHRWKNGSIVGPTIKVATPTDLTPLILEKGRFAKATTIQTDVLDSYLPTKANDALNLGMQNIALGKATPEQVAADIEKLVRAEKK